MHISLKININWAAVDKGKEMLQFAEKENSSKNIPCITKDYNTTLRVLTKAMVSCRAMAYEDSCMKD